jgi:hypothetical protein
VAIAWPMRLTAMITWPSRSAMVQGGHGEGRARSVSARPAATLANAAASALTAAIVADAMMRTIRHTESRVPLAAVRTNETIPR